MPSADCPLAIYSPTGGQFYPVYTMRSAHIFALGLPLPSVVAAEYGGLLPFGLRLQPDLTVRISAPRYLSCYLSQGWTCSLIAPFPHDMLDTCFGFCTLAERTSKQPGSPGTQIPAGDVLKSAPEK